ncbi:MAG: helix-turn-helix transcriptional regulator [Burkholderiales bacterium]
MKIKDQIRSRREKLGMSALELANRSEVSETAVRWWESGRSSPSRRKAKLLEVALSFQLDWTEGAAPAGSAATAASSIDPTDVELLLSICRLPHDAKQLMSQLSRFLEGEVASRRKAQDEAHDLRAQIAADAMQPSQDPAPALPPPAPIAASKPRLAAAKPIKPIKPKRP